MRLKVTLHVRCMYGLAQFKHRYKSNIFVVLQ